MFAGLTRFIPSLILFPFRFIRRLDGQTSLGRNLVATIVWLAVWVPGLAAFLVMVFCPFSTTLTQVASEAWFPWGIAAAAISVGLVGADDGLRRVQRLSAQQPDSGSVRIDPRPSVRAIALHISLTGFAMGLVCWWGAESHYVSWLRVTFAPICAQMDELTENARRGGGIRYDESLPSGPPLVSVYRTSSDFKVCTSRAFNRADLPDSLEDVATVAEITQIGLVDLHCRLINWQTKTSFAEESFGGATGQMVRTIDQWGGNSSQQWSETKVPWDQVSAWIRDQVRAERQLAPKRG